MSRILYADNSRKRIQLRSIYWILANNDKKEKTIWQKLHPPNTVGWTKNAKLEAFIYLFVLTTLTRPSNPQKQKELPTAKSKGKIKVSTQFEIRQAEENMLAD